MAPSSDGCCEDGASDRSLIADGFPDESVRWSELSPPVEVLPSHYFRRRRFVVFLSMVGTCVIYLQRVCMSVVAEDSSEKDSHPTMISEFEWSSTQQGILLGGFYGGYAIFQVSAAWFSRWIGAGKVFALGMLLSSVFTVLTPLAADSSFALAVLCRILVGMSQSVEYVAASQLVTFWSPPLERAQMICMLCSGAYLGTLLCYPLSGVMLQYFGWRAIMYTYGCLGLVWGAIYIGLVKDTPEADNRIDDNELKFILSSQSGVRDLQANGDLPFAVVIKHALCSRAVWALLAASFCNNFGFYMLVSELPTFMHEVFHINEQIAGLLAVAPYFCFWLVTLASGIYADLLVKRGTITLVKVRQLCFAVAEVPPAFLLLAVGYTSSCFPALVSLFLAIGCNGFFNCAVSANVLDVGGRHSGVVYALANTAGTIPAIAAEPIFGIVTDRYGYTQGFRIGFWICAGLYILGSFIFGVAASGKPFLPASIQSRQIVHAPEAATRVDNNAS